MKNFLSKSWGKVAALGAATAMAVTTVACGDNGIESPTGPTGGGVVVVPAPTTPVTPAPPGSTFTPAPGTTKELRDHIDALYFCEGPSAHKQSCNGRTRTFGLDQTKQYTVRMSDAFDDRARARIMESFSVLPNINPVPTFFAQRQAYNISNPPESPDYTITVLETTAPSTDCNAPAMACATGFFGPDGATVVKGTILNTFYSSTETHEIHHFMWNHVIPDNSVMHPQVSWHTRQSELDLAARAAVKALGLDVPNIARTQFREAGLINPIVPIPNSAQILASAPPGLPGRFIVIN